MSLTDLLAWITAVATVATAAAVIATFFIYRRQAIAMEAQLAVAREQIKDLQSSRASQQLYEVISRLLDVREEVETVLALRDKDINEWSSDEINAAHIVCSRFHVVGVLVLQNVVPEKLFAQAWFYSVPTCFAILQPFLEEMRTERDPRYWTGFDELCRKTAPHISAFKGFASDA